MQFALQILGFDPDHRICIWCAVVLASKIARPHLHPHQARVSSPKNTDSERLSSLMRMSNRPAALSVQPSSHQSLRPFLLLSDTLKTQGTTVRRDTVGLAPHRLAWPLIRISLCIMQHSCLGTWKSVWRGLSRSPWGSIPLGLASHFFLRSFETGG